MYACIRLSNLVVAAAILTTIHRPILLIQNHQKLWYKTWPIAHVLGHVNIAFSISTLCSADV